VVDELGSRREVEYAFRILSEGSSADRQLAVWQKTGDLKAVVDSLIAETAEGVGLDPVPGLEENARPLA
jgi:carboxylate-amine ligase